MNIYEIGFCKKAEEYGVDPAVLIKEAGVRGNVTLKALNGLIRNTPRIIDHDYAGIMRHTSPEALSLIGKPLTSSGAKSAFKGFKAEELLKAVKSRIAELYKDNNTFRSIDESTRKLSTTLLKREDRLRYALQLAFSHPELNDVSWTGHMFPNKKRLEWLKGQLNKLINQ